MPYLVLFAEDVPHHGVVEIEADNDDVALEALTCQSSVKNAQWQSSRYQRRLPPQSLAASRGRRLRGRGDVGLDDRTFHRPDRAGPVDRRAARSRRPWLCSVLRGLGEGDPASGTDRPRLASQRGS